MRAVPSSIAAAVMLLGCGGLASSGGADSGRRDGGTPDVFIDPPVPDSSHAEAAPDASGDAGFCASAPACSAACAETCCRGRCLVPLASGQSWPLAIAVDATNVYWTNSGFYEDRFGVMQSDGAVLRVDKDGGTPVTLAAH